MKKTIAVEADIAQGADIYDNPTDTPITEVRTITVSYFALFREQSGIESEQIITGAGTPDILYKECSDRYGFYLHPSKVKVAVNDDFSTWDYPLKDGDKVVFVPPVAGG